MVQVTPDVWSRQVFSRAYAGLWMRRCVIDEFPKESCSWRATARLRSMRAQPCLFARGSIGHRTGDRDRSGASDWTRLVEAVMPETATARGWLSERRHDGRRRGLNTRNQCPGLGLIEKKQGSMHTRCIPGDFLMRWNTGRLHARSGPALKARNTEVAGSARR